MNTSFLLDMNASFIVTTGENKNCFNGILVFNPRRNAPL